MGGKKYKAARRVRIAVSLAVMAAITVAIALGYGTWLAHMQIVPALLSCSVMWLAMWTIVTALAGRVYCSSACPLGTLQDIVIFFSRRRRRGFFHLTPRNGMRWCVVIAAIASAALGVGLVVSLLDPYSTYARIESFLILPIVRPVVMSIAAGIIATATLVAVTVAALLRGRLVCNTVCPVGTLLGALSRYSLFHVDINTDKCIGCGLCVSRCKAGCINPGEHTVDLSRCVVCFDCLTDCPAEAITFRRGRHQLKMPLLQATGASQSAALSAPSDQVRPVSRREFLASVIAGGAVISTYALPRRPLRPINYTVPPGAQSRRDYIARCTACGACAAACPTGVIKASDSELGLRNAMHPVMDFDLGPCRYDCTACTHVCPTGALSPLTPGEKHRFVIGKARIDPSLCVLYAGGGSCGICARRCPRQAIKIEDIGDGRRLPEVDFDTCIGCGECVWVCPARPRAFVIEGE